MSTEASIPENLPQWVAAQRWYADKGSIPRFERIGGWRIDRPAVVITTHYLLDHGAGRATLYQVPLTERAEQLEGVLPVATIGDAGTASERFIYDAPADPAYAEALLEVMLSNSELADSSPEASAGTINTVSGHRQPGAAPVEVTGSHVLRGEQSNTSIIVDVVSGPPVIIKVFRALHHGENPDVTLQSAIAAAGSALVPRSIGAIEGSWSDSGRPNGRATGHLAFAQEFLPGVEDAWRVALQSAEADEDFTAKAHKLGVATAEVHSVLAAALPTRVATSADIDATLASMRLRHAAAEAEVPSLAEYHVAIEHIYEAARLASWPALQRIHGDYHLGQVLWVHGRGWVLLDFEGEPMRPMAERSELDLTLRDVAGMLRSFDYVAGSVAQNALVAASALAASAPAASASASASASATSPTDGPVSPAAAASSAVRWAEAARLAFMDGYTERSGFDLRAHRLLLDAFEIDKALYEAVYEARNRPAWIDIPVSAIGRLAAHDPASGVHNAEYI
ncbi:putative trehalose synthase [Glaciihabitans tibetensis]|uniref:Maltokinase n=1 Tax=Glaciihabitans tibetensis TaxID=1266600 RepID=A0A2T0VHW7_9MICO|nr:phosphotransferase [Glaciihabitans tibetensis]PRY69663.1 putative trehalose synthase [Glaciihabitans tibetensis]